MNTKNKFILLVIAIVVIEGVGWFISKSHTSTPTTKTNTSGVSGDPVDITLNFYKDWLKAKQSTTTDPYTAGLVQNALLSQDFSQKLATTKVTQTAGAVDPVLCQSAVPTSVRAKSIFTEATAAKVLVLSVGGNPAAQAVVSLSSNNGRWQIIDITCSSGESAPPQGQYSFDQQGQLLKGRTPTLDPKYWYVVYSDAGVSGYTAPLLLDSTSVCVSVTGVQSACAVSMFTDLAKVHVQGNMAEAGLKVKHIDFLQ